jgi:hypothetical protein
MKKNEPLVSAVLAVTNTKNRNILSTTNPYWVCVMGYDLFSLCISIHNEGLCPSSGDNHYHYQPINFSTAGAQAFLMDYT